LGPEVEARAESATKDEKPNAIQKGEKENRHVPHGWSQWIVAWGERGGVIAGK